MAMADVFRGAPNANASHIFTEGEEGGIPIVAGGIVRMRV